MAARFDFIQHLPGAPGIFSGGDESRGLDDVEQVMRRASTFGSGWFRRANLTFAHHRDRIAIHDFAMKFSGERERKRGFPAPGGAYDNQQKRIAHGQRKSRWMALQ